jgi:hypothetical protein
MPLISGSGGFLNPYILPKYYPVHPFHISIQQTFWQKPKADESMYWILTHSFVLTD